jgi:hypothetical protein
MYNDGVLSLCAGQRQTKPFPDGFGSNPVLVAIKFLSSVMFTAEMWKIYRCGLSFGKTTL